MKRLLLAFAALLLALPVAGSAPVPARAARPPVPLLWKACDSDNCLYLLGSFHLLAKSDYPLGAEVERAFAGASSLVFEVTPEDLADPSVGPRMLKLATSDPERALANVLPADLKEPLDRRLRAFGMDPDQMAAFEPWFVDTMLVTVLGQRAGYSPEDGLDRHLMARAKAAGKPTSGLETVESQLIALDSTPMPEQLSALRDFIEEGDNADERLDELHDAWREADLPTLERLVREEMLEKAPDTYRRLNVERNRAWAPKLDAMLARPRGDVLVVVGALHLLGSDGLVEGLRQRGFRIERVCDSCQGRAKRP